MRITLLGTGHHLHAARRIDGFSSCVHRAEMRDEHGKTFTAYVKAFPTNSKALANEVAGWLLCRALGIPCPPRAYLCLVPIRKLRKLFPDRRWPGRDDDAHPCFATEDMHNAPVTLISETDSLAWRAQVQQWPHLPAAIALCHWLHNIDSNPGNLLHIPPNDFALIDHADIFGGQKWDHRSIKQLGHLHNKLLYLSYGNLPPPPVITEIEASAKKHAHAWQSVKDAIIEWWQDLLKNKEMDAAISTLEARAEAGWIKGKIA